MRLFCSRIARIGCAAAAFARSTHGGATLTGGVITLTVAMGVGGLMTNYAWHEAQWTELRAAARAGVAAAGALLRGGDEDAIKARVAGFAQGLVPGLAVEASDVIVTYDEVTDTTTVTVGGGYDLQDIWRMGAGGGAAPLEIDVGVRLEVERYEVALALDVSPSMSFEFDGPTTKLEGLKAAVGAALDVLQPVEAAAPGSIMVSVVPYASAVRVADTCNPDPNTGFCRADRSAGKERFVRMLAGVRDTMAETLQDARAARTAGTGGHWVDTFHHYGAGTSLGPLRRQYLPSDLLDDRDWNLRRTGVDIDVQRLVPALGTWTVDDEDFWNGCVMARWGAYWQTAARPAGWTQDHAANWPATRAVAAWRTAASALPATTPLHLSDAPPVASSPSTLFTAYSWPDAAIAGRSDGWMQGTMAELLEPQALSGAPNVRANYWSRDGNGGALRCPRAAVLPLVSDIAALRSAVDELDTVPPYVDGFNTAKGATYLNLGIVWALRTLSPLWQGVWAVQDPQGVARPGTPCGVDEAGGCVAKLNKSIIFVTDGTSEIGGAGTQLKDSFGRAEPANAPQTECTPPTAYNPGYPENYDKASLRSDPDAFNARFRSPHVDSDLVDADGRLNADGQAAFVDAFIAHTSFDDRYNYYGYPSPPADTPGRRAAMLTTLSSASSGLAPTPWELFRGLHADVIDKLVAQPAQFGFDGRPGLIHHACRVSTPFGPYGRADDLVYVGDVGANGVDPAPIADVAPFDFDTMRFAFVDTAVAPEVEDAGRERLNEWLGAACGIVGARGVRINAVYIGTDEQFNNVGVGPLLEACVDAAGGDPNEEDIYVVPTAADLVAAFRDIVTVRRNLRFLDS